MCFIGVKDVDAVYEAFVSAFKQHTGKVPRSGIPRISKVRDLRDDRRFTLTDPGGNTFYIGTARKTKGDLFFRTLHNEEWAKKFAALYDVVYSKEDPQMAETMLPKYAVAMLVLDGLDKAKLLLLYLEIRRQLQQPLNDGELIHLMETSPNGHAGWKSIRDRYQAVLRED
jgi:hypothetical protein